MAGKNNPNYVIKWTQEKKGKLSKNIILKDKARTIY